MIKSYLKSALRNIARQKGYSLINIAGLAIGIASSLAILLWVVDEVSYDKFHTRADSVYRCYRELVWNGQTRFSEAISLPVGPAAEERIPGIIGHTRIIDNYVKLNYETSSTFGHALIVDPSFTTMFSFPFLEGDPQTALSVPNSVVLTQSAAVELFADQPAMGKVLDNGLVVTGVVEDVPRNSSIEFDYLVPLAYAEQTGQIEPDEWYYFNSETYFLVREDADITQVGLQIKDMFKELDPEATIQLRLQPLADVHLKGISGGGPIVYVYIFSAAAILLLAVACVNFMNLATARAARRTVEIGIRKAVGASRSQLAIQVLIESLIQSVAATILALCLLEASLPALEELFARQLTLELSAGMIAALVTLTLFVALAAGSYPAVVLSSFGPAGVIKSRASTGPRSMNRMRKALVMFQFAVSTGLIFCALVIHDQMNFINNRDLGIERENIVCIRTSELAGDYETFKSELLQHSGIRSVSAIMEPPAWCGWHSVGFDYEGKPEDENIRIGVAWVDHDYVDLFGLDIVEGRNFSREFATDESGGYLINQAAAKAMGMESPVGKSLDVGDHPGSIIGVVKDFHYASLHSAIGPLAIGIDKSNFEWLAIKLSPDNISGSLDFIEGKYRELRYGEPFHHRFFDDLLGREYRAETRTGKIILSFTLVTILVACLGLFGLAAYSAQRRQKEIGIRKVLGSSVAGIIRLLTTEFLVLVLLGNAIVAPLVYFATSQWLKEFAYRIELGWEVLALSSTLGILIAIATVCFQAVRAAQTNPVDSLKYE